MIQELFSRAVFGGMVCCLSFAFGPVLAGADGGGHASLFDGSTLEGWTQRNGTATYRVEDGCIVGRTSEGSPNSFLCSDRLYGDFDLLFEVRVDDRLNSGVQIRSQSVGDTLDGTVNGPQIEIATGGDAGYVYGESAGGWMTPDSERPLHGFFRKGEWNSYRVRALGAVIQVWLNGHLVSDLTHEERFVSHPKGFIGLQVHSIGAGEGPYEVRWRNLKLMDLSGFVPLYNGRDLEGWETEGNWLPQPDGTLRIQPREGERGWERYASYLWTQRQYSDFVLALEYCYPAGGNSGVHFRAGDRADPVRQGIEVQILDSYGHEGEMTHHDHGGVIATQGASKNMSLAPGEWNQMVVSCVGNHLQVELNGEPVVDLQLDQGAMKDRPASGFIGLQDHGEPNNLQFRNILLKDLATRVPEGG